LTRRHDRAREPICLIVRHRHDRVRAAASLSDWTFERSAGDVVELGDGCVGAIGRLFTEESAVTVRMVRCR
jgi:hypothetical protein